MIQAQIADSSARATPSTITRRKPATNESSIACVDGLALRGIDPLRDLDGRELRLLAANLLAGLRAPPSTSCRPPLEPRLERVRHRQAEHRDREQPRGLGDRVVDAGGDAGMLAAHRAHDRGRERRHGERHAEVPAPRMPGRIRSSSSRRCPARGRARIPRRRSSGPMMSSGFAPMRSASPPAQRDRRKSSSTLGIIAAPACVAAESLHLHQVHRHEEEATRQRRIEEERDHVGAAERGRAEERERQHRRGAAPLDHDEGGEQHDAGGERATMRVREPASTTRSGRRRASRARRSRARRRRCRSGASSSRGVSGT